MAKNTKTAAATPAATEGKATKCPISRKDFNAKAKPLALSINGETKVLAPKEFSTGSFGFFSNEKVVVMVDGVPVKCQANILLTVIGSKDAE